jgi:hypothetical protein
MTTRRKNDFLQELAPITCDSGIQAIAATSPVAATGTITCVSVANLLDTDYMTIGDGIQKPWIFEFDKAGDGASARTQGYPATGTVLCDTNANGGDGDTLTISDGINPAVVYEYDKSSNGVAAGHIQQAAGTTAASNATALRTLILANQPDLTVTDDLAGTLTITHKINGTFANIVITKTGTVYKTVTGMAGGVDSADLDGVTHGRKQVNVSSDTTAADVAARLRTAILAVFGSLTVTDNADGTLTVAHNWLGTGGNVAMTENVANAGFLVVGLTGGTNAAMAATVGATTTQKFCKVPRIYRVDDVEWLTPTTVTQDAANYWDIELMNGSTSVAKWSTLTSAQGTITGGTGVTLVNSATDASLVFAAGDTMSLVLTKHGSPAALPPGRLTVHGHYVS